MKDDVVADLEPLMKRADDTRDWLKENGPECFTEQKHIRGLNQEKIYWHYGYLAAIVDVLRFLGCGVDIDGESKNNGPSGAATPKRPIEPSFSKRRKEQAQ